MGTFRNLSSPRAALNARAIAHFDSHSATGKKNQVRRETVRFLSTVGVKGKLHERVTGIAGRHDSKRLSSTERGISLVESNPR